MAYEVDVKSFKIIAHEEFIELGLDGKIAYLGGVIKNYRRICDSIDGRDLDSDEFKEYFSFMTSMAGIAQHYEDMENRRAEPTDETEITPQEYEDIAVSETIKSIAIEIHRHSQRNSLRKTKESFVRAAYI